MNDSLHEQIGDAVRRPPPIGTMAEPTRPSVLPAPPRQASSLDAPPRARSDWEVHLSTPTCFGVSLLLVGLALGLGSVERLFALAAFLGIAGMVAFFLSSLVALTRALRAAFAVVRALRGDTTVTVGASTAVMLGNLLMAGLGMAIAYVATTGFSRGRQIRRFGRVLLPDLRLDPTWATCPVALGDSRPTPAELADQWRDNGKTEHASVAAFARLTLDLMALGAPPALVAAANQDALDEIRHAELCFSLAQALDGKRLSPAPFPQAQHVSTLPRSRTLALARLAVDSLIDGALHEGVSARIIAKVSERCEVPTIRHILKQIAADEGRHSAHGWAVASWCLAEGGNSVGLALLGAVHALPAQMNSDRPDPAANGEWERWGIHGHALEANEYAAGREHVIQRTRALVARQLSDAA